MDMVCVDFCHYDMVSGTGFICFAEHMVNFGMKFGQWDVQNVLPHLITISWDVKTRLHEQKQEVIRELQKTINTYGCAYAVCAQAQMWNCVGAVGVKPGGSEREQIRIIDLHRPLTWISNKFM